VGIFPAAAAASTRGQIATPVKGTVSSHEAETSEMDGSAARVGGRAVKSPLQLRPGSPVDFTGARRRLSSPDRGGVGAHADTMGVGMGAGSSLGAQTARALPLLRQEVEALSAMNQSLNDALEEGERHWTNQQARYTSQLGALTAEVARLTAENGTVTAASEEAATLAETELAALRKEIALNSAAVAEGAKAVQEMGVVQADIDAAVKKRIEAELENLALVRKERGIQSATIATMREQADTLTMKFKKSVMVRVEQDNTIRDLRSQLERAESCKVLLEQSEGDAAAKQARVLALETDLSGATVELRDRSARVESLSRSLAQSEELFKAHTADANAAAEELSATLRDNQTHVSELTAANTVLSSEVSAAQEQVRLLESQLTGDSSSWQAERVALNDRAAHLETCAVQAREEEKRLRADMTAKARALSQAEASIVALEGHAEQRERARVLQEEEASRENALLLGKLASCEKALGEALQQGVEAQLEVSALHASIHSATQEAQADRASASSAVAASDRGEQTARKLAEALRAELEQTRARAMKEAQESEAAHAALKTELDACAAHIRRDADSAVQRVERTSSKLTEALRGELELTRVRAAQAAQEGEEGYAALVAELKATVGDLNAVRDAESALKREAKEASARHETEIRQVQSTLEEEQRRVGTLTSTLTTSEVLREQENAAAAAARTTLQEELNLLKGSTLADLKNQLSLLQRQAREATAQIEVLSGDLADTEGSRDALLEEMEDARLEHSATRARLAEATSSLESGERAAAAAATTAEQLDQARVRLNEVETHACLLADQLATAELKLEASCKDTSRYSALYKQATESGVALHAEASARIAELETALSTQEHLAQTRLLGLNQAQTNEEVLTQRLTSSGAALKERDANARDLYSQLSTCRDEGARLQAQLDDSCNALEKARITVVRLSGENATHVTTIKGLRGECDDGAAQAEAMSAAAEQAKERHSSGQAVLAELQSALRAASEDLGALKLERGMTQQKVAGLEERVRELSAGAVAALSELDARSAHLKQKEAEVKVVQAELGHTTARLDELLALSDGLEAQNSAQTNTIATEQALLCECKRELQAATEGWQDSARVLKETKEELTQSQVIVAGLERKVTSVQDVNAELHKTLKAAQMECGAVQAAYNTQASTLTSALTAAAAAADLREALDTSTAEVNDLQRSQHVLSLDRQKQTAALNKLTVAHESLQASLLEHEGREQTLESQHLELTLELATTQRALASSANAVKMLEQTSERRKVQLSTVCHYWGYCVTPSVLL
jgi:chromosome segregation ATPase